MRNHADLANEMKPRLDTHDRNGYRLDRVTYTPSYHTIMKAGLESGVCSMPFEDDGVRCEVTPELHRAGLMYMCNQLDPGPCCPLVMTSAGVSLIADNAPGYIRDTWLPKLLSRKYDSADKPVEEKEGATLGMSMTEKQSGSDVRTNTTYATPTGSNDEYEYSITGHKWFTSAPNSDGFVTLAKTGQGELTCFLVPRYLPNGTRNFGLQFQRLKDKLGDHSNASSEVEYQSALGYRLGEEGEGVKTIIGMVNRTRLDCGIGSAGGMDRALGIAKEHTERR